MDQMRVIVVPRKSFPKLLDRPFGRRMGRNVPVHDLREAISIKTKT
jgi:hypothetical protein